MVPVASPTERKPFLEWVLKAFPDTPKSRAKQWIAAGRVRVNGVVIRKPHQSILDPGPGLELLGRDSAPFADSATCLHRQVALVYFDSSLAIVNKGAGIISVPAPRRGISALSLVADFLAGRLKAQGGRAAKPLPAAWRRLHPLPVHRLDEYTSGLFCLALNPQARELLIQQLRDHSMRREYVAYVEGRLLTERGTWRNWLRMSADQRRQEVLSNSKGKAQSSEAVEATTHYEVITEYLVPTPQDCVSKLRLRLKTGYKHQIRVQAASAGFPLIGDRVYNPRYLEEANTGNRIEFARQALHSRLLQLEHPEQPGRRLSWTAELPKDLCELEARLRAGFK
jgi:23S rRNA pseudouridine1911/1915/1917 synthase